MPTDHDSTFASFLADVLRRIDRGEAIDRERLLADHEELRPQLESFFHDQSLIGELLCQADLPTNGEAYGKPSPANPGRFADFELLEEIGRGGMGVVYRARQARPNRIVALKMVLAGRHASATALKRFQTEAEAAARLRHPSIVPIHQVGEHDGLAYYVMDFIEGEGLDDRLARGPLPPRTAAEMLLEITRAVAHAHAQGVVHRDLKPANILIEMRNAGIVQSPTSTVQGQTRTTTDNGRRTTDDLTTAYITDFGLARLLDTDDQLTITGEVVGTACYMSPEQAGHPGSSIGPAADIYGLGAVLYAMLTGRPPFQAASRDQTIAQVKIKEPAPPRSINAAIPRDLETIALKCLQKSPARRYPSAQALADDLARYLAARPITARPVSRTERALRLVRRNPVTSSLISLLAMSLIAGAVIGVVLSINANRHAADSAHHLYIAHMNLAQQYWDAGRTAPVLDILRRYIPKEGEPDVRGWEWHYQWSLCHRELRRFGEWKGGVQCVAISPDGTLTAAAGDEGLIQVFDTATGSLLSRLTGHKGAVYALIFSPDGTRLASGGTDRDIRIWDVAAITPLPSGSLGTRRGEERLREGQSNLKPETSNLKPVVTLSRHTNDVRGLSFSPDGSRLVSSSEDGNAWLWDMKTHAPIHSVATGPARAIAFHPVGDRFVCASRDGVIHLWNVANGKKTVEWSSHGYNVYGLAFNRAGDRLFSASSDCFVRCIDVSNGDALWSVKHTAGLYCLSLASDERTLAVGSSDQSVRLFDVVTGEAKGMYRSHTDWVHGIAFLPDGSRLLSASADGSVRLWNELCAGEGRSPVGHTLQIDGVAFCPNGSVLATASQDGNVCLWDTSTGLLRTCIRGSLSGITRVSYSPNGKCLAAAARDGHAYLWDASTLADIRILHGHTESLSDVAFSADSSLLATGSNDGNVRVWLLDRQHTQHVFRADSGNVAAVALHPDNLLLATAYDDGSLRTWDVSTGKLHRAYLGHDNNARTVRFSPDGVWFASSGGDGTIRIWDTTRGEESQILKGHDGTVYSIDVSSDGTRIVSGGNDQTVKLWDVRSGQELRTFRFGEQVRSVAFSPDGRQIAASGADGIVRIWTANASRLQVINASASGHTSLIDLEALGFVIHLFERGIAKPRAKELVMSSTISQQVQIAAIAILDSYRFDEFAARNGHLLAKSGNWPAAATAFARAAEAAPEDIQHLYHWAICELMAERHDRYKMVARHMFAEFKIDDLQFSSGSLLHLCMLVDDSPIPLGELQAIANRLDTTYQRQRDRRSGKQFLSREFILWQLRAGDAKLAERLLLEDAVGNANSMAWNSVMSIIQAKLGNRDAALESVSKARAAQSTMPTHWLHRAISELHYAEATRAIEN